MKKNIQMKRIKNLTALACFMAIGINNANAQTGINTKSPHESAALEIKSIDDNTGLLIPKINLPSVTDQASIKGGSPATGLMIFNTNTALPAGIGFYYWDGSVWKKMIANGDAVPGDNLGDHTATEDLKMNTRNIIGAKNITASDVITAANATVTAKTTTQTAAITAGTDGSLPVEGYVATAADANGNIIWKEAAKNNVVQIKKINSNYMVTDTDYTIIASGLSEDITITLPSAASNTGRILVINQNTTSTAAGDTVKIKFDVPVKYSDTVSKNELLAPFYSGLTGGTLKINLQSDGTDWFAISSL